MITEVSRVYDLVVIDTAPMLAVPETPEMMALVDAVVFCARLGRTTVEQARNVRTALARLPERPTALVLTDLDPGIGGYYGYTYSYDYSASGSTETAQTR
jgi:Mrp family chromosome partitioning ATPase